jgi:hypothetical protein
MAWRLSRPGALAKVALRQERYEVDFRAERGPKQRRADRWLWPGFDRKQGQAGERDEDDPERLVLQELPDPISHGRRLVFHVANDSCSADNEQPAILEEPGHFPRARESSRVDLVLSGRWAKRNGRRAAALETYGMRLRFF